VWRRKAPKKKHTVHGALWPYSALVACGRERSRFSARRTNHRERVTCEQCSAALNHLVKAGLVTIDATDDRMLAFGLPLTVAVLQKEGLWISGPTPWRTPGANARG